MAIDPTQLAEDQEARQRITAAGAPTEFAKGPEQEGIQVAGLEDVLKLFDPRVRVKPSKLPTSAADGTEAPKADPRLAPRMPTPQERGLVPDPGMFSETATKRALASDVLSPEGLAEFERRGLKTTKIGEELPTNVVQDAAAALDEEAADVQQSVETINKNAQQALTANQRGYSPESALADEEITDAVLKIKTAKEINIKTLQDGGDFNFDYMNTTDDVLETITALGEALSDETVARTRGVIGNETTIQEAAGLAADEIGFSRELLKRKVGDRPLTAAEFVAARDLLVKSADRLTKLAEQIRTQQGNGESLDAIRLKFRRQLAIHSGIQLQLKGAQTEAARALQSFQIPVTGELDATRYAEEATRLLSESGAADTTDALAKRLLDVRAKSGIAGVNEFANRGKYAKAKQMVHEAYLAGLLSSPATQFKNFLGTGAFMLYQIPSEFFAGMYGSVIRAGREQLGMQYKISEDQVYVEDALLRFKGYIDAFSDALAAGSIAWRTEMPSGATKLDVEQYGATRGVDLAGKQNVFATAIDEFAKRMRIPFRMLLAADEFTKTISQRGELYTLANKRYKHSLRQGLTEQQAKDEAAMFMLDPGASADDLLVKARFDTLQSDLGIFGKFAGMVQRTAVGRFLFPFVTAPTNAILRTLEYTPFSKTSYEALGLAGPRKQQHALGRLTLGGFTAYGFGMLAAEGKITGGMPHTQAGRDALPEGWQPYSFVVKGEGWPEGVDDLYDANGVPNGPLTYISYSGFEPVGGLLAISADAINRMNNSKDNDLNQYYAVAAAAAAAEYFKELPMLQGVADLNAVLRNGVDPGRITRSYAENAAIVPLPNPLSSFQRMFERLADPVNTKPRDDIEYYTIADVEKLVDDGKGGLKRQYADSIGRPDYDLVGLPKTDLGDKVSGYLQHMHSYMVKDSFVRTYLNENGVPVPDERDLNAPLYDSFGEIRGEDDYSFANRPVAALFGNLTGIRLKRQEELLPYERELQRLYKVTGSWPLSNPETMGSMKLSYGAQADLIAIAKNTQKLPLSGYGDLTFRETIATITSSIEYQNLDDQQKLIVLRRQNRKFLDAGFASLILLPDYENMRTAFENRNSLKDDAAAKVKELEGLFE